VPVLEPGNGKNKTGQIWTYVRDDWPSGLNDAPAAWFAYSTNRAGEHPQAHLKGSKGHCKPKRSLATTRFMRPAPCAKRDAWRIIPSLVLSGDRRVQLLFVGGGACANSA
jgi:Transposase IS66 family